MKFDQDEHHNKMSFNYSEESFESECEDQEKDTKLLSSRSSEKWKLLSNFVLHEDRKVFRMALANVNQRLYSIAVSFLNI